MKPNCPVGPCVLTLSLPSLFILFFIFYLWSGSMGKPDGFGFNLDDDGSVFGSSFISVFVISSRPRLTC